MISSLLLPLLLAAAPVRAEDWLASAQRAAAAAFPGAAAPAKAGSEWIPYEPESRLFHAELPPDGWKAFEEDDALGAIVRVIGPEDPSGDLRAELTVRLVDRDAPSYVPIKAAVDAMRREGPGRETTAMQTLRVNAGLARVFEVAQTLRAPGDDGPSAPLQVHEYVAVIPRGEAYFVVRLISARSSYLDFRDAFTRFLKSIRPMGDR